MRRYTLTVHHADLIAPGNPLGAWVQPIPGDDDAHAAGLATRLFPPAAGWFWHELAPLT